ncbi:MAG: EFR1 family ferrodoxin [Acholeplasmatales bacterium]|jgi:ferredoxin|nr:EFR1 family ferrodoxin [Acholeplasmatales bacterium]
MDHYIVFSGTGNCLYCVNELVKRSASPTKITILKDTNYQASFVAEALILVFPVYAYTLPLVIKQFIKYASINCNYLAVMISGGSIAGRAFLETRKRFKKRQLIVNYEYFMRSPENFGALFASTTSKNNLRYLQMTNSLSEVAHSLALRSNKIITEAPFLTIIPSFFFSLFHGSIFLANHSSKKCCNSCGLCVKICPFKSVTLNSQGRPKFNRKTCNHCQRCINYCPTKAISMLLQGHKKPRFVNKFISLKDYFS